MNNKLYKLISPFILVGIIFISGCGGMAASNQKYFILKSSNTSDLSLISGEPKASIRSVNLPDYLKQRNLVIKKVNKQIKTLSNEFWAERLSRTIPIVLSQELTTQLKSPVEVHPLPAGIEVETIIELDIFEFLGDTNNIHLKASYRIVKPQKLITRNFTTKVVLHGKDTQSLVNGYQIGISRLAVDIGKNL